MIPFSSFEDRSSRRAGLRLALLAAAAVALVLGCGDSSPTGPQVEGPLASVRGVARDHASGRPVRALAAGALAKCEPLPYDSVTETIGPRGGTIRVGAHLLVIPPRALKSRVTITTVTPSDTINLVQFQPEGLIFDRSPTLIMRWGNCDVGRMGKTLKVVYLNDALDIVEYLSSRSEQRGRTVSASLQHFSGYAVAW